MYRQPNEQYCIIFIPIVSKSSDEILATFGKQKSELLNVFYSTYLRILKQSL